MISSDKYALSIHTRKFTKARQIANDIPVLRPGCINQNLPKLTMQEGMMMQYSS